MSLIDLEICHLRNLDRVRINPNPKVNIFYGENGAGKTSLLEGVYLLGTGKSFRTNKVNKLIGQGHKDATIFGQLSTEPKSLPSKLGVRRSHKSLEIHINGQTEKSRSKLAQRLPLMVITPESHSLLAAGPSYRRKYLDWGVFHVEPDYPEVWLDFNRVLKQRNRLLQQKARPEELLYWTERFVDLGEMITLYRKRYLDALMPYIKCYAEHFIEGADIDLVFKTGAPANRNLSEILSHNLDRDIILGRTEHGPHRADLGVKFNGRDIADLVSRGQQKLLVYAFQLAQCVLLKERHQQETALLLDDIAAELDAEKMERISKFILNEFGQIFITTTSLDLLPDSMKQDASVFHVEHGNVQ
jgi:DNA replication and repair protein RecF